MALINTVMAFPFIFLVEAFPVAFCSWLTSFSAEHSFWLELCLVHWPSFKQFSLCVVQWVLWNVLEFSDWEGRFLLQWLILRCFLSCPQTVPLSFGICLKLSGAYTV